MHIVPMSNAKREYLYSSKVRENMRRMQQRRQFQLQSRSSNSIIRLLYIITIIISTLLVFVVASTNNLYSTL